MIVQAAMSGAIIIASRTNAPDPIVAVGGLAIKLNTTMAKMPKVIKLAASQIPAIAMPVPTDMVTGCCVSLVVLIRAILSIRYDLSECEIILIIQ